jgi:hypothetical protein
VSLQTCRVTIRDREGTDHSVVVTASTLYEAVALGLAAFRSSHWVPSAADMDTVRVSVTSVPVQHSVKMRDFDAWLEREGGSPRDVVGRARAREILGMAAPRRT